MTDTNMIDDYTVVFRCDNSLRMKGLMSQLMEVYESLGSKEKRAVRSEVDSSFAKYNWSLRIDMTKGFASCPASQFSDITCVTQFTDIRCEQVNNIMTPFEKLFLPRLLGSEWENAAFEDIHREMAVRYDCQVDLELGCIDGNTYMRRIVFRKDGTKVLDISKPTDDCENYRNRDAALSGLEACIKYDEKIAELSELLAYGCL